MKNRYFIVFALMVIWGCDRHQQLHEDVVLFEIIAMEQLQKNNELVNSMRAQLEFYGALADEAAYYQNSEDLVELRDDLMKDGRAEGMTAFADSVDHLYASYKNGNKYKGARDPWDAELERIKEVYRRELNDKFDSATYYKFKYTILKKEHALHLFNAQKMSH